MNVIRACATGVVLFAAACGGSNPEPEYRWEEEETTQIDEDHRPPPAPPSRDVYDDEDDEDLRKYEGGPSRSGATTGTYGGPRSHRGAEGAIFTVKRGVFCDESVRSCYTTKGGHPGVTEEQFGDQAGRRLAQRIEDEGNRGARGIGRVGDGVVCDRLSEVCYDHDGASLPDTREEFGHDAAEELALRVDRPRSGPRKRNGIVFSPRQGVLCDEQVAACYVGDAAHTGHTKRQFGADAARALERRIDGGKRDPDGIFRPRGGVVCDRLSQACYDRDGVNVNATLDEFGREAAVRLTKRLE
ncbi:MAG TPA: YcgJ family protein [Myxococcota bacterium]|nr:YcgJ family protein [Myxococcota bacterium]